MSQPLRRAAVLLALLALGPLACSEQDIVKVNAWMYSTEAQARLATMYRTGRGVDRDLGEAARWYRKAADAGVAEAQIGLASMYEVGEGVPRDPAEAFRLYHLAAAQGRAAAQYALGRCYDVGVGVAPDPVSAHAWFHLAALGGVHRAFRDLKRVEATLDPEQVSEARRRTREAYAEMRGTAEPS